MSLESFMEVVRQYQRIEAAIAAHPQDGLVYEDDIVKVERVNGKICFSGQPLRIPFHYEEA